MRPLDAVKCPGPPSRECGAELLPRLEGDAEQSEYRFQCPICDEILIITVKRAPVMCVVEATVMPEATTG